MAYREVEPPLPEGMEHHPEGGRYRRVFCSEAKVTAGAKGEREAVSHIYFALSAAEKSSMHRVDCDEMWNLYKGDGVYLYLWDGLEDVAVRVELSERSGAYCYLIPAGMWQAAEPVGGEVLVGCSVAPAFTFVDFTLLRDAGAERECFSRSNPDLLRLL